MDWAPDYVDQLKQNRARIEHYKSAYDAFAVASERAAFLDELQGPTDLQLSQLLPPAANGGPPEIVVTIAAKDDLIAAQKSRVSGLESQLAESVRKLETAQERARLAAEEAQLRTKFVESLQEEVLALTLQSNLAQEEHQLQFDRLKSKLNQLLAKQGPDLQAELAALEADFGQGAPPHLNAQEEIDRLQSQLDEANRQLEAHERRIKNMLEEQQLKSRIIQDLNDEILSLTMQLNLTTQ